MTEPRIPPLPPVAWSDEMWSAISVLGAKRPAPDAPPGRTSNILGIYAHHPALVAGWMPFSQHLKHSTLPDRVREMSIIRTTWLGAGEYEWAQHRGIGKNAGLTDAEIDALSDGPAVVWSPAEGAVLTAVDELVRDRHLRDETWSRLTGHYRREQLIDLVFTVGTYDMHCLAFNALGLQLDEGLQGFPANCPRGGAG